jgi:hypothetical protein
LVHQLAKLMLEICAVLVLCGGAVMLLRSRFGRRIDALPAAAGLLALLTVAGIVADVHTAGGVLNRARRDAVGPRAGLQHCFGETNGEAGPRLPQRLPFINWVKQRLPAHAVYTLAPSPGPPDAWCVALVLLPALPARAGERAGWTITFGTTPPDLQARIARQDPSVQVFAPGFALTRESLR